MSKRQKACSLIVCVDNLWNNFCEMCASEKLAMVVTWQCTKFLTTNYMPTTWLIYQISLLIKPLLAIKWFSGFGIFTCKASWCVDKQINYKIHVSIYSVELLFGKIIGALV